jgi:Asp-tRNA(Asn)/Glu-tRNA(Gln) amidotransferase A subunit family amidase
MSGKFPTAHNDTLCSRASQLASACGDDPCPRHPQAAAHETGDNSRMKNLHRLSAVEAARQMAQRTLSAEAYARACMEHIAEREPQVQAFAHFNADALLKQARALDAGAIRGPLHGLLVGVKDIFDTFDMPTEYGSAVYKGHQPAADAAVVALTRQLGGIVAGKTVTTEFATFPAGKTRNPLNPAHTPGGSSSGSAAGVAEGMFPLAFGTQTAGSVIRPAAYCGVTGYKPSFGMLARGGVKTGSDTLDTIGLFSRGVEDAAYFIAALTRRPALQLRPWPGAAPRIGFCKGFQWSRVQPEMAAAFDKAATTLAKAGARIVEVTLPARFEGMAMAQATIMSYEGGANRADDVLRHGDKMDPRLAEQCTKGLAVSGEDYAAAQALANECRAQVNAAFGDCDVWLAAAALGEAPEGLSYTGDPIMNGVWTLLHTPCITVNAGTGPKGLPVGLQIVGRIADDSRLLSAADWIGRAII